MDNSQKISQIVRGMISFNQDVKDSIKELNNNLDRVLNPHYQINHKSTVVNDFKTEVDYWKEILKNQIYLELPSTNKRNFNELTYVMIRGQLSAGTTIHYNPDNYGQLYICGSKYTGDYTFNGDSNHIYENIFITYVQTVEDLNSVGNEKLKVLLSDNKIKNAEIYCHISTLYGMQPEIEELLVEDTCRALYVEGSWNWKISNYCPIETLDITGDLVKSGSVVPNCPCLQNYIVPNTSNVLRMSERLYSLRNIDFTNCSVLNSYCLYYASTNNTFNTGNLQTMSEWSLSYANFNRVVIADLVLTIGNGACAYMPNLTELVIGNNVEVIPSSNAVGLCLGNTNLRYIKLGKSILQFSGDTKWNASCSNLQYVEVERGYHCPTTPLAVWQAETFDWTCLKGILENCANVGEEGRTSATMVFRVSSSILKRLIAAYDSGDETALAIYDLKASKSINITT